jgi:hypothetical protein
MEPDCLSLLRPTCFHGFLAATSKPYELLAATNRPQPLVAWLLPIGPDSNSVVIFFIKPVFLARVIDITAFYIFASLAYYLRPVNCWERE